MSPAPKYLKGDEIRTYSGKDRKLSEKQAAVLDAIIDFAGANDLSATPTVVEYLVDKAGRRYVKRKFDAEDLAASLRELLALTAEKTSTSDRITMTAMRKVFDEGICPKPWCACKKKHEEAAEAE